MKDEDHIICPNIPHLCDICIERICLTREDKVVTCSLFRPKGDSNIRPHAYDNYPCKKCAHCDMEQYAKELMFCNAKDYCWKDNDWGMYVRRRER
ncbi:MAG: hypothetical protein M0R06_07490 [Sphaerochaeta sp.]|jgi:hypothetical protein|nr:hypothetical protein [Sphaerochaeta sp.]